MSFSNSISWKEKTYCHIVSSIIISLFVLNLIGCATSDSLKRDEFERINSVTLSKEVKLPEEMFYMGDEKMAERVVFGVFGYMASQDDMKKSSDFIIETMERSEIDVGKIVFDKFREKLNETNIFNVVNIDCDDCPKINLSVRIYGFSQIHGFSSQLRPMLGVEGVLTDTDESILWKKYSYITNVSNKTPANTLEEYLKEPESIKVAFSIASEIVTDDLINHMQNN
jgi:hypothetical protein